MQDAWISFARTGAPHGLNHEPWPAYTVESEVRRVIDTVPRSSRVGDDPIVRLVQVLRAARRKGLRDDRANQPVNPPDRSL
jgi:carboxylesterase type B